MNDLPDSRASIVLARTVHCKSLNQVEYGWAIEQKSGGGFVGYDTNSMWRRGHPLLNFQSESQSSRKTDRGLSCTATEGGVAHDERVLTR